MNKILQGDALEQLKTLETDTVDMCITSPPYNCGIDYGVYKDNLPWQDYLDWSVKWMGEVYRVLKDDGRFCLNVLLEMGIENNKKRVSPYAEFYRILNEVGFNTFGSPVWVDSHRVKYTAWGSWKSASSPYIYNPYEIIILSYKKQWKKLGKGKSTIDKEQFMMGCSGIWKLRTATKGKTPANFHTDLPEMCMRLLSYEGDTILDPFFGSGTVGVAAIENNRKYIGIELNPEYIEIAERRLSQTTIFDIDRKDNNNE